MPTTNTFARPTRKTIAAAIQAVEVSLARRQFGVLWHLDINEKLVDKGLEPAAPFHVLEVCSAPRARTALTTNQQVGYFLPCKIVVYEDQGQAGTVIGLLRPRLMMDLLGDPALEPLADEVEDLLLQAITEAAGEAPDGASSEAS
jgi:uncharacterized protein (DUF302 family)